MDEPGDHDGQPEQQVRRGQRRDEDVRRPLQSRKGIKYIVWLQGLSLAKLPSPPTLQVPPTHSVHGPILIWQNAELAILYLMNCAKK